MLSFDKNTPLHNIRCWLEDGNIIVLHNNGRYSKTFCNKNNSNGKYVIYINFNPSPDVLDDGEWPYYITNEGYTQISNLDTLENLKNVHLSLSI